MMLQRILFPALHFSVQHGRAFGPLPRHRFDLYLPRGRQAQALIVYLYGGSWTRGSRALYRFLGAALTARGYGVAVADYRLFPEVRYPEFIDDSARAVAFALRDPKALCGAAVPVFVMGHSAGGYNAAMLALDPAYLRAHHAAPETLSGVICLAAPLTFDPLKLDTTRDVFATSAGAPDQARPVKRVRKGAPPFLLIHGERDTTVGPHNSKNFAAAMADAGGRADLRLYPNGQHINVVTGFAWPLRWQTPVLADVTQFQQAEINRQTASVGHAHQAADAV